jgi:hypothetical protein
MVSEMTLGNMEEHPIQELLLWRAIRLARTIPGGVWARGGLVWVTGGQQGGCPWVAHTVRAGCGNSRLVHTESGHETALSPHAVIA